MAELRLQYVLLICTGTLISAGFSAVVMDQDQDDPLSCDKLTGTWEVTRPDQNYSDYYRVRDDGLYLLFESHSLRKLPFGLIQESHDFETLFRVDKSDFVHHILTINKDCLMTMVDASTWKKVQDISKVHVIFMNHLDVGYNVNHFYPGSRILIPGYVLNVLNWYFQVYFPRAARLADELRDISANETFIYTTHPWLVSLFFDCPNLELSGIKLQCPTEDQKSTFRRAVWMGDITWHAGPLNFEAESTNPELLSYGLTLSERLDKYFGITRKARTLSQRDVPGMTRAAIPHMLAHNIVAMSFGVNGKSAPPDVPSPNVWIYRNHSMITYWHKGGYPMPGGHSIQQPGGMARKDCQFVEGLDEVLCFAFRSDNLGPPDNVLEIKTDYKILRHEFPGAQIQAARFEDFTELLIPLKDKFPVVDAEIGDTWIQGPASDPVKMIRYRTINRLRSECLKLNKCSVNDPRFDYFSRMLVKLPEHTYGLGQNYDNQHWSNDEFLPLQYTQESFKNNTLNYLGHRAFNDFAVQALKDHPLAEQIRSELEKLKPYLPDLSGYTNQAVGELIKCENGLKFAIGTHGGLTELVDNNDKTWASDESPLGKILYRTYDEKDFIDQARQYNWRGLGAFWKINYENAHPESKYWDTEAHGIYIPSEGDPCSQGIYVRVLHANETSWFKYGAPTEYFLKYTTMDDYLEVEYQFFNKPSTRMVEALFLSFESPVKPGYRWLLHKIGDWVDPSNVVNNGSQYVHAVDMGVGYLNEEGRGLVIESLDAATVNVLTPERPADVLPVPLTPMTSTPSGVAFNFYNNVWETNFIFWYPFQPQDKHYKARFNIRFT